MFYTETGPSWGLQQLVWLTVWANPLELSFLVMTDPLLTVGLEISVDRPSDAGMTRLMKLLEPR